MPIRPILFAALLALPVGAADPKPGPVVLTEAALKIHREAPVFDGHNDLPWQFRKRDDLAFNSIDISRPQPQLHTDLPRLRKGGVGAQFWSAYVSTDTIASKTAVTKTLEQIDAIRRMVDRYPDDLEMASTADDVVRIRKAGKIASMIGVEGGHSIDNSLGVLRCYYRLGVRYMTLTHSATLDWADAATDKPKSGGLSKFGEEVVREMNALGMLVDLSHVSPDTMKAAIKISKAPIIFSHSSARAVADHPRNVPDDVLKLTAENGGVVMVNFFSGFIVPEGARATRKMFEVERDLRKKYPDDAKYREAVEQWQKENDYPVGSVRTITDHIDHIVKVAGVDHAGIGSDFDGVTRLPAQMGDVSCYPYITQDLLDRGYTAEQIHKILGGNVLRVLRAAEKVGGVK